MPKEQLPLTEQESLFLQAAMLQAQQEGDEETVQRLADLAQDPEQVRTVLGQVKNSGEGE